MSEIYNNMNRLTRRLFLKVCGCTIGAACLGCVTETSERSPGPVYLVNLSDLQFGFSHFPIERLGIFREKSGLKAVNLLCTHQTCLLEPSNPLDRFICPCHGSQFDLTGAVLKGPASKSLQWYELSLNELGQVLVDRSKIVPANWELSLSS